MLASDALTDYTRAMMTFLNGTLQRERQAIMALAHAGDLDLAWELMRARIAAADEYVNSIDPPDSRKH